MNNNSNTFWTEGITEINNNVVSDRERKKKKSEPVKLNREVFHYFFVLFPPI